MSVFWVVTQYGSAGRYQGFGQKYGLTNVSEEHTVSIFRAEDSDSIYVPSKL
jgi:hypothetical protein